MLLKSQVGVAGKPLRDEEPEADAGLEEADVEDAATGASI
jgi:hypothetical protein